MTSHEKRIVKAVQGFLSDYSMDLSKYRIDIGPERAPVPNSGCTSFWRNVDAVNTETGKKIGFGVEYYNKKDSFYLFKPEFD
jgi:hypothetical protein